MRFLPASLLVLSSREWLCVYAYVCVCVWIRKKDLKKDKNVNHMLECNSLVIHMDCVTKIIWIVAWYGCLLASCLVLGWHGWQSNEFWSCVINNGCVVSPRANVDATFKRCCPIDTSADCQNSYKPSKTCIQMLSELDFYRGGGSLMGFICCCTVVMHMHLAEASEPWW